MFFVAMSIQVGSGSTCTLEIICAVFDIDIAYLEKNRQSFPKLAFKICVQIAVH